MRSLPKVESLSPIGVLYMASFLLAFHLYAVIYINSSFLTSFPQISEDFVGTIYIIGSLFGILSLLLIDKILVRFGSYPLLVTLTIYQIFAYIGFAFISSPYIVLPLFVGFLVSYPLLIYILDIFLKCSNKNIGETGEVRGTLLTIVNVALLLAPLTAGFILSDGEFWKVYTIAALFLVPFFLLMRRFRTFEDPIFHKLHLTSTISCLFKNKNITNIFITQFILRFFFAWAVIYMPIYLIREIGFTWTEFGIMTFIYLIPFALLEYPAGLIADQKIGEKWLLALGFFIAGIFTVFISIFQNDNFLYWVSLLFMIRVGLSLVEIMTESYFFKHIDGSDNNTISFFRIMRPMAYVIGPLVANVALFFVGFQYIWIIAGVFLLYGIVHSLMLRNV